MPSLTVFIFGNYKNLLLDQKQIRKLQKSLESYQKIYNCFYQYAATSYPIENGESAESYNYRISQCIRVYPLLVCIARDGSDLIKETALNYGLEKHQIDIHHPDNLINKNFVGSFHSSRWKIKGSLCLVIESGTIIDEFNSMKILELLSLYRKTGKIKSLKVKGCDFLKFYRNAF